MAVRSINPYTLETNYETRLHTREEIETKIVQAHEAFKIWKKKSIAERCAIVRNMATLMSADTEALAHLDVIEMGMPLKEALGDAKKSASNIDFFCDNAERLIERKVATDGKTNASIVYEPLGVIFSVMPWNFPFNQVLRSAIPNIIAGNAVIMKHASNVPMVALKLEELFENAGVPKGLYANIFAGHGETEYIISHPLIIGANVTGSTLVGTQIGSLAGKNLKPSVLELGGSDPFIVLDCKNLDAVASDAVKARFSNAGQKCNSAKRFIVLEHEHDEFAKKFAEKVSALKIGNPLDASTDIGPLAKKGAQDDMVRFVEDAVAKGAKILTGGKKWANGYVFEPTVLVDVTPDMLVWKEEVFGPIAPIMSAKTAEEATQLANNCDFGLGCSVYADDFATAESVALQIEAGNVAINKVVTSYAFLPYGGIKKSGYGKELAEHGLKVFMNEKVIVHD